MFKPDFEGVSSASGWVVGCDYDEDAGELYVLFNSRAICIYREPISIYHGLLNTDSAGSYVHEYLYDRPYRLG